MIQEESRSTATLPPEEPTPVDPDILVTTYADSLIAELFDDVDKILDGDEAALAAVEAAVEAPPEPASTALAPIVETTAEPAEPPVAEAPLVPLGNELDIFSEADAQAAAAPAPTKSRFGQIFDRLLLTITALSLMGIAGLLWFNQSGQRAPDPETAAQQSDQEFLAYLQRSLDVIAARVERGELGADGTANQLPTSGGIPAPPMLPPLGAGGTVGSLGSGPVNVIERVYIPYQTTQQPAASLPDLVPQPGAVLPAPIAPAAPAAPATPAPGAPAAAPIHSLVGILELGNRSAALFEISGVSQRVYIGERIGSSGWTLVSVANEVAVIRRNGDVRSIYMGQRF
ncbi:MAG: hypothetical protein EA368_15435 [Leptolyngbya sp. DLM2.Bin27]|nr:MAG: hypothetical protein EA368_15435 [Leptolyngbya sp. DLM2.Bin27]